MSRIIIIRGPLGVGKTTIARQLAEILDGKLISIDHILARHRLDKVTGRCIPPKNFIKANKLILPAINKELAKGRTVIIEGNFYHKGQLTHLLKNAEAEGAVFTLSAPIKTCIQRDSRRKRAYGEGAARAVHKLVKACDAGTRIETGGKTAATVKKRILSLLE